MLRNVSVKEICLNLVRELGFAELLVEEGNVEDVGVDGGEQPLFVSLQPPLVGKELASLVENLLELLLVHY